MLLKSKEAFCFIRSREEIATVPANKIVRFAFDKDLLIFCQENGVACAVEVSSISEAIYANHYGAAYLIASKKLAKNIQTVADTYLFDTKVLVEIRFEWELDRLAAKSIDGAILPQLP